MKHPSAVTTFLFTDIEGSTRLWEQEPERMPLALARHDTLVREAIEGHQGTVVKTTGDGVCATFGDPLQAIAATVQLQQALADPQRTNGVTLRVRCGIHIGVVARRDNDYFGSPVNRAARLMSAAHGGQVLVSQAVVEVARERLPVEVSLRDLGSVRLRDLASPEHVYQVVHPQLREDFPALRSSEVTPNNLPLRLTSFVGRERAIVEIEGLLARARLVTLLGAGGIGKTRLSLRVAVGVLDDYPDGVWFVELAPLADPQQVVQTVATVLGVKEEAGRSVVEALVKYVKRRRLLLVLDNCEHLVEACGELIPRLLQFGPDLKILVSSRELLQVAGETTYAVPALAVPDANGKIALEELVQYEAVQLFVDRARLAVPEFQLGLASAAAVGEICRRLDGIPLAIELAAARVKMLSVAEIRAKLVDRFRLLTGGSRSALARHQTLRATIQWSYDHLAGDEQRLFRLLSVFAGGWTLDAAVSVSGDNPDEFGTLDLLTQLANKSLVMVDSADAGVTRYSMLESLRQYAQEQLNNSKEGEAVRARHLDYYVALVEKAEPQLSGSNQVEFASTFAREHENLLLAHETCDHAEGGAGKGLRFAYAMRRYWYSRGLLELGNRVTNEALGRPGAAGRTATRARALLVASDLNRLLGRYDIARRYGGENLSIAREIEDKGLATRALFSLGSSATSQGDLDSAQAYFEESLALARELEDKVRVGYALYGLGDLHRAKGHPELAEPLYEEALEAARVRGDSGNVANILLNLARVSVARGAQHSALVRLREALTIAEETNSEWVGAMVLDVSAGLAASLGQWSRAARLDGAAEAAREKMGLHLEPIDEQIHLPLVVRTRTALGETTYRGAYGAGRVLPLATALAEARMDLEAGTETSSE